MPFDKPHVKNDDDASTSDDAEVANFALRLTEIVIDVNTVSFASAAPPLLNIAVLLYSAAAASMLFTFANLRNVHHFVHRTTYIPHSKNIKRQTLESYDAMHVAIFQGLATLMHHSLTKCFQGASRHHTFLRYQCRIEFPNTCFVNLHHLVQRCDESSTFLRTRFVNNARNRGAPMFFPTNRNSHKILDSNAGTPTSCDARSFEN